MNDLLCNTTLIEENLAYAGTGGLSQENRSMGFIPAFYDVVTGRAEIARFADGRPAPMHLLEGLPGEWVKKRDASGRACAIKGSVISGFIRGAYFYTRKQAAEAIH
ncbi:MAG: hypothetical protein BMS9Abin08_0589 [Gammaproteobacteria bacterium]|nr:MAG: hypothetical protein BMS9Abin08_0589 [Gammaproteobacteria bacterium]